LRDSVDGRVHRAPGRQAAVSAVEATRSVRVFRMAGSPLVC
jgi:hypothetical protein